MTSDRDVKRKIRARMAKTGESYQTARRQLLRDRPMQPGPDADREVEAYFKAFAEHVEQWRRHGGRWKPYDGPVPVASMQSAALVHPLPWVRRQALGVLDHAASDESGETFRSALRDPVPRVRIVAIHALSCERCRCSPLNVSDVVSDLLVVVVDDPNPNVRHAAIDVISRFAQRDASVARVAARRPR